MAQVRPNDGGARKRRHGALSVRHVPALLMTQANWTRAEGLPVWIFVAWCGLAVALYMFRVARAIRRRRRSRLVDSSRTPQITGQNMTSGSD